MMKIKKLQVLRPEITVEYKRPILGRLYFVFAVLPRCIIVKREKINCVVCSKLLKDAGTVFIKKVWYIIIPKITGCDDA